jgi:hypothetical protein
MTTEPFMPKAAVLLFADTETPEGMGRMANALTTVKEFSDAGDDAVLIFDGAGTRWVAQLADAGTSTIGCSKTFATGCKAHASIARAYGVKDAIETAGIPLLDDYQGHPSVRDLMVEGRQVITF